MTTTPPAIPDSAHRLAAFVLTPDRQSGREWEAVMERTGPAALRVLVAEAHRRGYVTATDTRVPATDVAALDLWDETGDSIVGDLSVPTREAWDWWVGAADLRPAEGGAE